MMILPSTHKTTGPRLGEVVQSCIHGPVCSRVSYGVLLKNEEWFTLTVKVSLYTDEI